MASDTRPLILIVRDGWGRNPHRDHDAFNAVKLAATPVCDDRLRQYPWTLIHTSGEDVGLPDGTMGNSEVGHNALGAGKVFAQGAKLVDLNLESGQLYRDPGWAYIAPAFAASRRCSYAPSVATVSGSRYANAASAISDA